VAGVICARRRTQKSAPSKMTFRLRAHIFYKSRVALSIALQNSFSMF
jgi:hypothetical protein